MFMSSSFFFSRVALLWPWLISHLILLLIAFFSMLARTTKLELLEIYGQHSRYYSRAVLLHHADFGPSRMWFGTWSRGSSGHNSPHPQKRSSKLETLHHDQEVCHLSFELSFAIGHLGESNWYLESILNRMDDWLFQLAFYNRIGTHWLSTQELEQLTLAMWDRNRLTLRALAWKAMQTTTCLWPKSLTMVCNK